MTLKPVNRFVCLATFLLTFGSVAFASTSNPPGKTESAKKVAAYGKLPLQFELNQGQADSRIKMLAHGPQYNILLQPTAVTFDLHKGAKGSEQRHEAVQMLFAGANAKAALSAESKLPGYVNYMTTSDRSKWHTGVPTFARVRATAVYPGVDVVYYGTDSQLEFDMIVAPGADATSIHLNMTGAKPMLASNGELTLVAGKAPRPEDVVLRKPVVYQMLGATRQPIESAFTVAANGDLGLRLGSYDHTRELVIDPIVSYASFFGGSGDDAINGSALNSNNQLYVVGQTKSTDLLGTTGEFQATNKANLFNNNYPSAFVTKFSADGTAILWTTYLGGTAGDTIGNAIAVSSADQAYITGLTASTVSAFPITSNAVQPLGCPTGANSQGNPYALNDEEISFGCGGEVFVSQLSSDGKTLVYSTYLGGASNYQDVGTAIALDAANNIYVAGYANSTGYQYWKSNSNLDIPGWPINQHGVAGFGASVYPTTQNAYMTSYALAKVIAVAAGPDGSGNVGSGSIPTGFLTEISADGSRLVYSTGIGGCGAYNCQNAATTVAPGKNGIVYVGGTTNSPAFPTTANAFIPSCTPSSSGNICNQNGWLAAFDTTKSGTGSLVFSTYMSGANNAAHVAGGTVNAVVADASGNVVVTGQTSACNFPTTAGTISVATVPSGDGSCAARGFLTKLSPAGATIWSALIQGPQSPGAGVNTAGTSLALDATGKVYLLANTNDSTLATKNSMAAGGNDGYLAELSADASTLIMGTYLGTGGAGGPGFDNNSLHLDSDGIAYISGNAGCGNYGCRTIPVAPGAFQPAIKGNSDGFVMKVITQQQPSATALTVSPAATAKPTDTVTLTATVTTSSTLTGSYLPTGIVTFLNGSTSIGTATLNAKGVATFSGMLPAGTYTITANYPGDAGFNASVSPAASTLTVTSATATTTALSVVPTTSAYGTAATLTATVMAGTSPATSGMVTFTAGSMTLGTANINASGLATLSVTPAVGIYSVIAMYAGTATQGMPNGFAPSTSAGVALTITKASTTVVLTSSNANAGTGVNVTLTATVSTAATGVTAPGGLVTFMNGTTSLGTATVGAGGMATLVTSFSTAGTNSLTAVYAGDTNYTGSTSTALTQVVVTPSFTVAASPASLTIARGSTGTTTLTFTPAGGYSGLVSLSCGTLPSKATCTFTPASVTLAGSPVSSTLTISTGSLTANLIMPTLNKVGHGEVFSASTALLPAMLLGLLLSFRRKQFRKRTASMVLLLAASLGVLAGMTTGCSGSGSTSSNGANATPVGAYTIPLIVTGSQGALQTVSLSVTVQ
jgi:hypothetical protein